MTDDADPAPHEIPAADPAADPAAESAVRHPAEVLLDATRELLWVSDEADARRLASEVVLGLGGSLVPVVRQMGTELPIDVSFGVDDPILAAAAPGSEARALLEQYLPGFVADARRALERVVLAQRLHDEAAIDVLTGLPDERLARRVLRRLDPNDVVVLLELDGLDELVDRFDRDHADEIVRTFARVARAQARGRDICVRRDGGEVMLVLSPVAGAEPLLARIRESWIDHRPRAVSFSAGIAAVWGSAEASVLRAEAALAEAQGSGGDRWQRDMTEAPDPPSSPAPRDR